MGLDFKPLMARDMPVLNELLADPVASRRFGGLSAVETWTQFVTSIDTQEAWLAFDGGKPVGLIIAEHCADGSVCPAILVHAAERGRGYGRAMLAFVIERSGPRRVWAEVEADNAAGAALALACGLRQEEGDATPGFVRFSRAASG